MQSVYNTFQGQRLGLISFGWLTYVCLGSVSAEPVELAHSSYELSLAEQPGKILIKRDDQTVAVYVYEDPNVTRPYWIDLTTLRGRRVTRNHPPRQGDDLDHPHHTGVFFSFGDLNGTDYWHNRGVCRHEGFMQPARIDEGVISFETRESYRPSTRADVVLSQETRHTVRVWHNVILFTFDVRLTGGAQMARIGSKEEGGLAIRVATPLAVASDQRGQMRDSHDRINGDQIWGKAANWVVYRRTEADEVYGVQMMWKPLGQESCWWHARDYGLLTANPFGPLNDRNAIRELSPDETQTMRFGLAVVERRGVQRWDAESLYAHFLQLDTTD